MTYTVNKLLPALMIVCSAFFLLSCAAPQKSIGVWVNKEHADAPFYVSIDEVDAKTESNLSLYPNPTNGNVYISFKGVEGETAIVNIMDINGRVVKTESLGKLNSGEVKYAFETNDLASGMYIVNINGNSGTKRVAKLIVTK